ncbi:MAG: hypothetical protein NVS3B25_34470 [Hymenobacter sp.]
MHKEDVILEDKLFRQLVHFSGITELVDIIDDGLANKEWNRRSIDGRSSFTHGSLKSIDASRECLLYTRPPAHVTAMAEAFKEALLASDTYRHASEKAQSTKRRRVFELDGGELDIDRHLGQQDECWSRVTRGLRRPLIRLAVSGVASGGNDETAFAGVAALGTCCALLAEQAGCSLEILGTLIPRGTISGTFECGPVLPIKHADEAFHQDTLLAFGIPAALRYYGFATYLNLCEGVVSSGFGSAYSMSAALRAHLNVQHVLECAWDEGRQQMFLDEFVKTLHDA